VCTRATGLYCVPPDPPPPWGMKFGKRLAAEAARRWLDHYLDYKEQKKAIQDDIAAGGAHGVGTGNDTSAHALRRPHTKH